MANMSNGKNGPAAAAGMYRLKPYYDTNAPVDLPDCMYRMKSVYSENKITDSTSQNGLEALEKRQNDILARLGVLRQQVEDLVTKHSSVTHVESIPTEVKKPVHRQVTPPVKTVSDLVITANPRSPPLSLFILGRLLADQCRVLLSTFVHSSARDLVNPKLLSVFKTTDGGMVTDRNSYKFGITVIWKDELHGPSLVVKPGQQIPIRGEANVARYLSRLLSKPYDEDAVIATQIDTVLDSAAELLQSEGVQSKNLAETLGTLLRGNGKPKSAWLLGYDRQSLADVVMWSALKQRTVGKLSDDLQQWIARCDKLPEFAFATRLIV